MSLLVLRRAVVLAERVEVGPGALAEAGEVAVDVDREGVLALGQALDLPVDDRRVILSRLLCGEVEGREGEGGRERES